MKGIEIGWAGDKGKEPEIIGWLRRKGKLGASGEAKSESKATTPPSDGVGVKADSPQSKTRLADSAPYSSFPSSFVRTFYSYRFDPDNQLQPTPADLHSITTAIDHETSRSWVGLRVLDAYENETG